MKFEMNATDIKKSMIVVLTGLQQTAVSPLRLYQCWVLPQTFVFVALLVASILWQENNSVLFSRLCAITYLLVYAIVWLSAKRSVVARDYLIEVLGLVLLLAGLSLYLSNGFVAAVGLPTALLIISGLGLALPNSVFILAGLGSTALLAAVILTMIFSQIVGVGEVLYSIGQIWIASAAAILFKKRVAGIIRGSTVRDDGLVAEGGKPSCLPGSASDTQPEGEELSQLTAQARRDHHSQLLSEFCWRLAVAMLIVLLLPFDRLVLSKTHYLFVWAGSGLVVVLLLVALGRAVSLVRITCVSICLIAISVGWWAIAAFVQYDRFLSQIMLFAFILLFLSLPWSFLLSITIAVSFLLLIVCQALFVSYSVIAALGLCVALMFAWREGQLVDFTLLARVLSVSTARRCLQSENAIVPLQLLAALSAVLLGNRRSVLVLEGGSWQIWNADGSSHQFQANRVVDYTLEHFSSSAVKERICSSSSFNQHIVSQLTDSFGYLPSKMYICSLSFGVEQRAIMVVPLSMRARLIGSERVLKTFVGICVSIRSLITVAQSGSQSSDLAINAQRSLADREHQFSRVIHAINNAAQDIVVICDSMRMGLGASAISHEMRHEVDAKLIQINRLAHLIAYQGTDSRLLREMCSLKLNGSPDSNSAIRVDEIIREFADHAEFLCDRAGIRHCIRDLPENNLSVKLVAGHYFETALRCLIEQLLKGLDITCSFYFSIDLDTDQVVLRMGHEGHGAIQSQAEGYFAGLNQLLRPVRSFVEASGGSFSLGGEGTVEVKLILKREKTIDTSPAKELGWCMFVDDNEQIIAFYKHIAEVLDLRYSTASTLNDARELLDRCGKPDLVVTDLQLGTDTGLSLIKDINSQFGDNVAIVVVSGDIEAIKDKKEIAEAKNILCLAKPLSRRRLFEVIQSLLREAV